jgi:hypothetical protein
MRAEAGLYRQTDDPWRAVNAENLKAKLAECEKNAMQAQCMPPLPERLPEIPCEIDGLFIRTDQLSERIARLEARLCSVLNPRQPDDCKKVSVEKSTPLASHLHGVNLRLDLMVEALDSIASRLEL